MTVAVATSASEALCLEALEMRTRGASWRTIAEALCWPSPSAAEKAVRRGRRRLAMPGYAGVGRGSVSELRRRAAPWLRDLEPERAALPPARIVEADPAA